jgi:glycosyltransferase 2 family protein
LALSGAPGKRYATAVPTGRIRPLAVVAGLAVSLVFSYLAVRDVDFEVFADALSESSYWWIAPALGALGASVAIRVVRWRYLFPPETRPPARPALRALLIGELFNTVVPVRGGELVRVVVIHRESRTSRPEALGTVLVERLLDVIVLLLLLLAVLPFVPEVTWLRVAATTLAVAVLVLLATILVLNRYDARPLGFLLRPLSWLPGFSAARASVAAESLLRGLRGVRDVRAGVVAVALTAASWLSVALSFWLAIRGLHLELGYDAAVLVVVATTFSLVIPALPTSVGVFEAATLVSLRPFGIDDSVALSCAVVLHVLSFLPFIVAGLVALRTSSAGRLRVPSPDLRRPPVRGFVSSTGSSRESARRT